MFRASQFLPFEALVGLGVVENLGIEIRVLVYWELGFKELRSRVLVIARIVRFPSSKFRVSEKLGFRCDNCEIGSCIVVD